MLRGRHSGLDRCEIHAPEFRRFGRIRVRRADEMNHRRLWRDRASERGFVQGVTDDRQRTRRELAFLSTSAFQPRRLMITPPAAGCKHRVSRHVERLSP
jgi:hypothetical protein